MSKDDEPSTSIPGLGGAAHRGTAPTANRTMPPATVMPILAYPDLAAAIDWLGAAFGFVERWRAGDHRAVLEYAGGAVMLGGADTGPAAPASLLVRVTGLDAHCDRARAHGAQIADGPRDHPYGERQYNALDLAGHQWTFSQSIADLVPEQWGARSGPGLSGPDG